MQKVDFTPPLLCRWFGHRWQDAQLEVCMGNVFGVHVHSDLKECARCGCGEAMSITGPKKFTPKAVAEYRAIEESDNVHVGEFKKPYQFDYKGNRNND